MLLQIAIPGTDQSETWFKLLVLMSLIGIIFSLILWYAQRERKIGQEEDEWEGEMNHEEDDIQEEMYHEKALKEETEACAKIADNAKPCDIHSFEFSQGYKHACLDIAETIRKRMLV